MDHGILANTLMALLRGRLNSHEESHVKVDSQTHEWLDTPAMFVSHRVNCEEDHAKSLLVTVRLTQRCSTVLVEAHVWLTGAQDGHVSERDAEETIVGERGD